MNTNPLSWTYALERERSELARMDAMSDAQILAVMPRWGYSPERGDTPQDARVDQQAVVRRYEKMAALEQQS